MLDSRMLYKYPGEFQLQDDKWDYIIVPETEVEEKLKEGWFLTSPDAKEAYLKGKVAEKKAEVKPVPSIDPKPVPEKKVVESRKAWVKPE
jgi:hypothetical protein